MNHTIRLIRFGLLAIFLAASAGRQAAGQTLLPALIEPAPYSASSLPFEPIRLTFDTPIDTTSFATASFRVYGSQTGLYEGTLSYDEATRTVIYTMPCALKEGERVSVTAAGIRSISGGNLAPFTWQFIPAAIYGSGRFEGPDQFDLGLADAPAFVFAGDLDGDLLPDAVIANSGSGSIGIYLNQGIRPRRFAQRTDVRVGSGPFAISGGDWNADGRLDLVVSNLLESSLTLVINDGNGLFSTSTIETGERPVRTAVGDFDNDGFEDIAVSAFGVDLIYVHRNNGDGTFALPTTYPVGASPAGLVAGDFDNDGDLDLYSASLGDQRLDFLRNDGAGAFEASVTTPLPFSPAGLEAADLLSADTTRYSDSRLDLVVSAQDSREVLILQNTGNAAALQLAVPLPVDSSSSQALALVVADIDSSDALGAFRGLGQDFDLDVVSAHLAAGEIRPFISTAAQDFVRGLPDAYATGALAQDRNPISIASADVDGDSDLDLLVVNGTSGNLAVFYNIGGREAPVEAFPPIVSYGELCVGEDSTQTVQLRNTTNHPISVEISVRPDAGVYVPDTTAIVLAPGETGSVDVRFSPLAAEDYIAELVLRTRILAELCGIDAQQSIVEVTVPLVGRGIATRFSAMPDTLDFGIVVVGDSLVQSFDLLNEGNIEGDIANFLAGNPLFTVLAPLTPQTVTAGGRQPVDVQFQPLVAGVYFDSLLVATVDLCGRDTLTVYLRAESVDPLPDLLPLNLALAAGQTLTDLRVGDALDAQVDLQNQFYPVPDTFLSRFVLIRPDGVTQPAGDIITEGIGVETIVGLTSPAIALTQAGVHQLCFDADALDGVLEAVEDNNRLCLEAFDVRPLLPDLLAADLVRADGLTEAIRRGQTHDYVGTVRNIGDLDVAAPFQVEILLNDLSVASLTLDGLAVGAEATFTAAVDFPEVGAYTLIFRVDAGFGIDEILEDNNDFILGPFEVELPDALPVGPNPFTPNDDGFNDRVAFRFEEFGLARPVVRIFSFEGRLIRTFDEVMDGALAWDGRDDEGRELRPGVYLYTVEEASETVATGHITLAR